MRVVIAELVALLLLLSACASDGEGEAQPTQPGANATTTVLTSTTTTSAAPVIRESASRTIVVADTDRTFELLIPASVDSSVPAPLVFNLHGIWDSASAQMSRSGFSSKAESEGIVLVHPDAIAGVWDLATTADINFFTEIIDDVSTLTAIDPDRVYAIGFSQGGAFATYLACHLPDRIAAVASVASLVHHDAPACPEHSPGRILTFAGETDTTVSIDEGLMFASPDPDPPGPLADETAAWATTNGCGSEPLETSLPEGVVRSDYECANGSALVVYVHPGGHWWPQGAFGLDVNTIIWDFLNQYSSPLSSG